MRDTLAIIAAFVCLACGAPLIAQTDSGTLALLGLAIALAGLGAFAYAIRNAKRAYDADA